MIQWLPAVVAFLGYWCLRLAGVPREVMFVACIWSFAVMILGWIAGRILANRVDCDSTIVQVINWSQMVTWVFPPVGIFLGVASYEMAEASPRHGLRMKMLGVIGGLAAFLHGVVGLYQAAQTSVA